MMLAKYKAMDAGDAATFNGNGNTSGNFTAGNITYYPENRE